MAQVKNDKRKPVREVILGAIRAAIWANENEERIWHTVSVRRVYQAGDQVEDTDEFIRSDLPELFLALQIAFSWMQKQSKSQSK